MLEKLKEKLKSWFSKTKEEAEEKIEEDIKIKLGEKTIEKLDRISIETSESKRTGLASEEKEEKIKEKIEEVREKEEEEEKPGFFKRFKEKFQFKVTEEYFDEIFSDLELILLENNVALEVVEKIKKDLKKELIGISIKKEEVEEKIKEALKISIESLLVTEPIDLIEKIRNHKTEMPFVIVFFGINGSGKTTTIAKIAYLLQKNNISCILAASDTFRAASIEQLEKHAEKLKVKVIKNKYGSDPASVAFDAISHAKSHKIKAVLIDTAGRMHTKSSLLKEMEKIVRVSKPDLKIFVAESITGNDAITQAKTFNEAIGIDAIILTKADVDEKGGTAISVSYVTGKPILYLGSGQKYEDLEIFNKNKIMKSLGLER